MSAAIPAVRRLWGVIRPGAAGRKVLALTAAEPDITGMEGALLLTGMLAGDDVTLDLDIVSDPKADPELTGPTGQNGWTPVFAGEQDGTRGLLRIIDWFGSTGPKPALGYIGTTDAGGLVAKAAAFNFNAGKRVDIFTGVTGSDGIASIVFDPSFTVVPAKALPSAVPNILAGPIKAELVAGSLTKSGCRVKVTAAALLTGAVSALAGASVNVIAIEA